MQNFPLFGKYDDKRNKKEAYFMKKNVWTVVVTVLLVISLVTNTYLYTQVNELSDRISSGESEVVKVDYDVKTDAVEIVKKVSDSVVTIEVYSNGLNSSSGSGVVYEKDGDKAYIVTNHHVVDGADTVTVLFNSGDSVNAKVLGSDRYTDLAVLEIEPDFEVKAIAIGDSNLLEVGETVLAIGSPLGSNYNGSTTQGIISGTNRVVSVDLNDDGTDDWDMTVLQTDAAINPGNSGGALINMAGELVGITSMKISSTDGMGFAIPISDALKSMEQLKNNGKIERPVIGIQAIAMSDISLRQRYYNNITSQSQDGIYVYSVQQGSAADEAGIEEGDIIVQMDDLEITTYKSFLSALYAKEVGDTVEIVVERDGQNKTFSVTLK